MDIPTTPPIVGAPLCKNPLIELHSEFDESVLQSTTHSAPEASRKVTKAKLRSRFARRAMVGKAEWDVVPGFVTLVLAFITTGSCKRHGPLPVFALRRNRQPEGYAER